MADQIRVRVETGMLGAAAGTERTLELTPLVQAAILDGRLTPLDQEPPELKGAALDEALRARSLPLTGSADEKRARLAEAGPADLPPGLPAEGTALGGATSPVIAAGVVAPAGTP